METISSLTDVSHVEREIEGKKDDRPININDQLILTGETFLLFDVFN